MLIHEYQESWVSDFDQLKKEINNALYNLKITVEHVGSTSVPKLAAKPIIDIDIVYTEKPDFDVINIRLGKVGYYCAGNQGIPDRDVFKRAKNGVGHKVLDLIEHHLYVCPVESDELRKHILFRDYLRVNEKARIQYQSLKYSIAEQVDQDRKKYAQLKESLATEFITSILKRAELERTT